MDDKDFIEEFIKDVDGLIGSAQEGIIEFVDGLIDGIEQGSNDVTDKFLQTFEPTLEAITNIITLTTDALEGAISAVAEEMQSLSNDAIETAEDIATSTILEVISSGEDVVSTVTDRVDTAVAGMIHEAQIAADTIIEKIIIVLEGIENVVTFLGDKLMVVADGISDGLDAIIDTMTTLVEKVLPDSLEGIGTNLADITKILSGSMGVAEGGLADSLIGMATKKMREQFNMDAASVDTFVEKLEKLHGIGPIIEQFTKTGVIGFGVAGLAFLVFLAQALAIGAVQAALAAEFMEISQSSMKMNTPVKLTVSESMMLLNREDVEREFVNDDLAHLGLSEERIEKLMGLRFQLLNAKELTDLWHRGAIDDDTYEKRLLNIGFRPEDIDEIKLISFEIPPVQDIITMAVREVFDPEIAEAFGQFKDYPPEFEKWAKQKGLTEEWAKNYWAAHWTLPSSQQGFEMLHRGVIEEDELTNLLKALDVMPFWRDNLKEIAYHPFTRVDVRRMHKLGILDIEQVKRAYMDLGFDSDKADAMTAFTLAYNAAPDEDEARKVKELTRSQIERMFRTQIFDEATAVSLLVDAGYSSENAQTIIQLQQIDMESRALDIQVDIIRQEFANRTIEFNEAMTRIDALTIVPGEKELIGAEFDAIRRRQIVFPSKADLGKLYKEGVIDELEYTQGLHRLGWVEPWPERFAHLVKLSKVQDIT